MAVLRAPRRPTPRGAAACVGSGISARYSTRPPRPESRPRCVMANIASQEKRILRGARRGAENRPYRSAVKTYFRRLEAAVESSDEERAAEEHRRLVQLIDK